MATKSLPDPELLRKLLRYEPETGELFWLPRDASLFSDGYRTAQGSCNNWNSQNAGKKTFLQSDGRGYRQGVIFNKTYKAHRVVWALVYGKWPDNHIDHINGVRDDNRIENLRDVTLAENNKNMARPINNKSGKSGVHFDKSCNRWRAYIRHDGKRRHIGCFGSFDEAAKARNLAEKQYGFHPNHGRSM